MFVVIGLVLLSLIFVSPQPRAQEIDGWIGIEQRFFPQGGLVEDQPSSTSVPLLGVKYYNSWDEGEQELIVDALYRKDSSDSNRDDVELRDFYWSFLGEEMQLNVGYRKVFWGVTEFTNPVDIINQTDLIDDPLGNEKLGQPMLNLTTVNRLGTFSFFLMPRFRDRVMSGRDARFRSELLVDTNHAVFEKSDGRDHLDYAVRGSSYIDSVDFSLSYFNGTERGPELALSQNDKDEQVLLPRYGQIEQFGLELQWTLDNVQFKYEGSYRKKSKEFSLLSDPNFTSYVIGLEYTFYSIFDTRADLGVIAEYIYDSRRAQADTPFEKDVFSGIRLAFNDEQSFEIVAGVVRDLDDDSMIWTIDMNRRIQQTMTLKMRAIVMDNIAQNNLLHGIRRDSNIELEFLYFFGL